MGLGFATAGAQWLGSAANICVFSVAANNIFDGDAAVFCAELSGAAPVAVSLATLDFYFAGAARDGLGARRVGRTAGTAFGGAGK